MENEEVQTDQTEQVTEEGTTDPGAETDPGTVEGTEEPGTSETVEEPLEPPAFTELDKEQILEYLKAIALNTDKETAQTVTVTNPEGAMTAEQGQMIIDQLQNLTVGASVVLSIMAAFFVWFTIKALYNFFGGIFSGL